MTNSECKNCCNLLSKFQKARNAIECYVNDNTEISNELSKAKAEIVKLKNDNEKLNKCIIENAEEIISLKDVIKIDKTELNLLIKSNKEIQSDLTFKESYLKTLIETESENKQLLKDNKVLVIEVAEIKQKLAELNSNSDCKSCMTLKDSVKTLKGTLKEVKLLLDTKDDEVKRLQNDIDNIQSQRIKLKDENIKLQKELDKETTDVVIESDELLNQLKALKAITISQNIQLQKSVSKFCNICKETASLMFECFNHNLDFDARTTASKELLNHYKKTKIILLSHLQNSLIDEMICDNEMKATMCNINSILGKEEAEKELEIKDQIDKNTKCRTPHKKTTRSATKMQKDQKRVDRSPSFDSSIYNDDSSDAIGKIVKQTDNIMSNNDKLIKKSSFDWNFKEIYNSQEGSQNELSNPRLTKGNDLQNKTNKSRLSKNNKETNNNDFGSSDEGNNDVESGSIKAMTTQSAMNRKTNTKSKDAKKRMSDIKNNIGTNYHNLSISDEDENSDFESSSIKRKPTKSAANKKTPAKSKTTKKTGSEIKKKSPRNTTKKIAVEKLNSLCSEQNDLDNLIVQKKRARIMKVNKEDNTNNCDIRIVLQTPRRGRPKKVNQKKIAEMEVEEQQKNKDTTILVPDVNKEVEDMIVEISDKITINISDHLMGAISDINMSDKNNVSDCMDDIIELVEPINIATDIDNDQMEVGVTYSEDPETTIDDNKEPEMVITEDTEVCNTVMELEYIASEPISTKDLDKPVPLTTQDNSIAPELIIILTDSDSEDGSMTGLDKSIKIHDCDMSNLSYDHNGVLDLSIVKSKDKEKIRDSVVVKEEFIWPKVGDGSSNEKMVSPMTKGLQLRDANITNKQLFGEKSRESIDLVCTDVENVTPEMVVSLLQKENNLLTKECDDNLRHKCQSINQNKDKNINSTKLTPKEGASLIQKESNFSTKVYDDRVRNKCFSISENKEESIKSTNSEEKAASISSDVNPRSSVTQKSFAGIKKVSENKDVQMTDEETKMAEKAKKDEIRKRTEEAKQIFIQKERAISAMKSSKMNSQWNEVKQTGPNNAINISRIVSEQVSKGTKKGRSVMDKLKQSVDKSHSRTLVDIRPINDRQHVIMERSTKQQLDSLKIINNQTTNYIAGIKRTHMNSPESDRSPPKKSKFCDERKRPMVVDKEKEPNKFMDVKVAQLLKRRFKNGDSIERYQRLSSFGIIEEPLMEFDEPDSKISDPVTVVSDPVTVVSDPVTVVSDPVTVVSDPVTVVSDPVTVVSDPVTGVSDTVLSNESKDRKYERKVVEILTSNVKTPLGELQGKIKQEFTRLRGWDMNCMSSAVLSVVREYSVSDIPRGYLVQASVLMLIRVFVSDRGHYKHYYEEVCSLLQSATGPTLINLITINISVLTSLGQHHVIVMFIVDLIALARVPMLILPRCIPIKTMDSLTNKYSSFIKLLKLLVIYEYSTTTYADNKILLSDLGDNLQIFWLNGQNCDNYVRFDDLSKLTEVAKMTQQEYEGVDTKVNWSFLDRIVHNRYK